MDDPQMTLLSEEFLSKYSSEPGLKTLLQRAVFLSKIAREEDAGSWHSCIRRVVEANCALDPSVTRDEAESLFDAMFRCKILPSGRGLRVTGAKGIPGSATLNCWGVELKKLADLPWALEQLMLGGGVGFSLVRSDALPVVESGDSAIGFVFVGTHPDYKDLTEQGAHPREPMYWAKFGCVPDTRQGWVEAYREVIDAAFNARNMVLDVSDIRPHGAPLRTFGGTASGPAPLVKMLRETYNIIRGAAGRRLRTDEWLHIITHLGVCVSSGGGRRSALLVSSDAQDWSIHTAKDDSLALMDHLYASNNSAGFYHPSEWEALTDEDWLKIANKMVFRGDYGMLNFYNARLTDPDVVSANPCAEQFLEDRGSCCVADAFPTNWEPGEDEAMMRLLTRFTTRQRLITLDDAEAERARQNHMRIGVGISGYAPLYRKIVREQGRKAAQMWLRSLKEFVREENNSYSRHLGVKPAIKVTTVKPSGTLSLVAGTLAGYHLGFAAYCIRRIDVEEHAPLCTSLTLAGVPHEPSLYKPRTISFQFPLECLSWDGVFEANESLEEQFERLVDTQEFFADSSVSCTIKAHPHEVGRLAELLKEYFPRLKTVSCLSRDAVHYPQAPYESICQEDYERRNTALIHDYPLVWGGASHFEECAGGACPV